MRGGPLNEDPLEKILAILAGQADSHPDRALHTLDALNEDLLPQFHRRRFEDASTDSEKVAYGARLVANRKATGADLVALAHACARSERLTEALSWILRAIEIQPFDGELLRFQASVLERLGKIDDALLVAEAARNLECDIGAVSADIVRLQERQSAQVRKFMATASPADRLAGYAKLVWSRRASVEDLIFLAQAAADEENLVDALEWISKAIDKQSHDGELHRFRATILERLSRFEEAHDAVTLASSRGADQHAVAGDIVRIRSLVIDEFRQRAREGDLAEFIICHGKLLRLGVLQADDFLILAWRIAAAPFRWVMIRSFDAIRRRATVGRGSQTASAPGRRAEAAS